VGTESLPIKCNQVELIFEIQDHNLIWEFYVIDILSSEMILGLDFLATYQIQIDFGNRKLLNLPLLSTSTAVVSNQVSEEITEIFNSDMVNSINSETNPTIPPSFDALTSKITDSDRSTDSFDRCQ